MSLTLSKSQKSAEPWTPYVHKNAVKLMFITKLENLHDLLAINCSPSIFVDLGELSFQFFDFRITG